jgi:hypothetical protein
VKIYLKDLPEGVSSGDGRVLKGDQSEGQIGFTVSYDFKPTTKQIRVVAECEERGIITELPLEMRVGDPKKKGKK